MIDESQASPAFDFETHRRAATEQYQRLRPLYESFADVVKALLAEALRSRQIKVTSIEARAKALESFADKAATPIEGNPDKPKYASPLAEIMDLAAARVITFFLKDIQEVDRLIGNEFNIQL